MHNGKLYFSCIVFFPLFRKTSECIKFWILLTFISTSEIKNFCPFETVIPACGFLEYMILKWSVKFVKMMLFKFQIFYTIKIK